MLDNTHREFQNYIPYIFSYSSEQYIHPIKTFTFQVTDACNLCCTYCYQTNKSQHVLDFDIAKNMIDYLFDNKSNPEFYFYEKDCTGIIFEFIGGEPLLQIDLIEKIMGYCDFKFLSLPPEDPWILNHMYSLCSNGMLYFEPKV